MLFLSAIQSLSVQNEFGLQIAIENKLLDKIAAYSMNAYIVVYHTTANGDVSFSSSELKLNESYSSNSTSSRYLFKYSNVKTSARVAAEFIDGDGQQWVCYTYENMMELSAYRNSVDFHDCIFSKSGKEWFDYYFKQYLGVSQLF